MIKGITKLFGAGLRFNAGFSVGLIVFSVFSLSLLEANPRRSAPSAHAPMRSLDEIFPGLGMDYRWRVFSWEGLRNTFLEHEAPLIVPAPHSGIDLLSAVREKNPTQLIEALVVVPYSGRVLTKLDAYNVIGMIQGISDQKIFSYSRETFIPLFEESTRLYNGRRNQPIPDPPPATVLPDSETVYIRLKDTFFGNTFLRGNLTTGRYGITYHLTNNAAVWFLMFPVMRAERFAAILYVEPIAEGMLVYSVAGIAIPEFIANRINLAANIDRRISVFMNWLSDGFWSMR